MPVRGNHSSDAADAIRYARGRILRGNGFYRLSSPDLEDVVREIERAADFTSGRIDFEQNAPYLRISDCRIELLADLGVAGRFSRFCDHVGSLNQGADHRHHRRAAGKVVALWFALDTHAEHRGVETQA